MSKLMKKRKMRGFTLVELLIVIIIIGILAGALLLVAGAGTDKANATKIVSDMRSIKAAAIMKYADAGDWDWANDTRGTTGGGVDTLEGYMDRDINSSKVASYDVVTGTDDTIWVEAYNIDDTKIQDKLVNMAEESGLYKSATSSADVYTKANDVFMKVK